MKYLNRSNPLSCRNVWVTVSGRRSQRFYAPQQIGCDLHPPGLPDFWSRQARALMKSRFSRVFWVFRTCAGPISEPIERTWCFFGRETGNSRVITRNRVQLKCSSIKKPLGKRLLNWFESLFLDPATTALYVDCAKMNQEWNWEAD